VTSAGDAPFVTLRAGRADTDEARLRIVAAVVCSICAGLFALARPGPLSIVVSLAVIAAGLAWAARARRTAERAHAEASLALASSGLTLTGVPEIPWADVARVDVDEDRLVVMVHRSSGDPVVIEPVYDGISVYDLAALVERCRSFGQSPTA
jgi:hypothetical protein